MKKLIISSLILCSTSIYAHNEHHEHNEYKIKEPTKSFGYDYSFTSGVEKNHLFEFYVNDNCLKECDVIDTFLNSKYLPKVKNIEIIKFHHTMLNNKFWKAPYSVVFEMPRYQELTEMNHLDTFLPQSYINNTYIPNHALGTINVEKLTSPVVGNLDVTIENNNIDITFEPKESIAIVDSLVDKAKKQKSYKIIDSTANGVHYAYVVLITPENQRYIPKGNNESNVVMDDYSVLGLDSKHSHNLNWQFDLPNLGHLDFEFLELVVWIEDENHNVIQTTSGRVFREYFRK